MHEQGTVQTDLRSQTDYRSRKFLAGAFHSRCSNLFCLYRVLISTTEHRTERNFYLHGFTLFLSLILSRVYSLVLDLIKAQEDLAIIKSQVNPLSFCLSISQDRSTEAVFAYVVWRPQRCQGRTCCWRPRRLEPNEGHHHHHRQEDQLSFDNGKKDEREAEGRRKIGRKCKTVEGNFSM